MLRRGAGQGQVARPARQSGRDAAAERGRDHFSNIRPAAGSQQVNGPASLAERGRSWWERPVAFGFAAAAALAAIFAVQVVRASPGALPHSTPPQVEAGTLSPSVP